MEHRNPLRVTLGHVRPFVLYQVAASLQDAILGRLDERECGWILGVAGRLWFGARGSIAIPGGLFFFLGGDRDLYSVASPLARETFGEGFGGKGEGGDTSVSESSLTSCSSDAIPNTTSVQTFHVQTLIYLFNTPRA